MTDGPVRGHRVLYTRSNLHVISFSPRGANPNRAQSALGVVCRVRAYRAGQSVWRHFRVGVYWTPLVRRNGGRGAYKFEADSWRTTPQTYRRRIGHKQFLRFKVGLGGPRDL